MYVCMYLLCTAHCPAGFILGYGSTGDFVDPISRCKKQGCEIEDAGQDCLRCRCCKKFCHTYLARGLPMWQEKCTWKGKCDFCPECLDGECFWSCPGFMSMRFILTILILDNPGLGVMVITFYVPIQIHSQLSQTKQVSANSCVF